LARFTLTLAGLSDAEGYPTTWTHPDWLQAVHYLIPALAVFAILTATFGNLAAYLQTNLKRLLAYSTIAHAGYMMMGLATLTRDGLGAVLFYLAAYLLMNLGAFAVVAAIQRRAGVTSGLDTFAGLGRREPWLAILMTLFLLSLTGIPPTAGFFAKAYVILAAVQAGQAGWTALGVLAVVAVLNAAAAAFYYLRVVVYMFMREPRAETPVLEHGRLLWGGLAIASVLTLALGLVPGPFLGLVEQAAAAIGS
jgi:NADH-quinone oxidoreductase subunit N